MLNRIMKEDAGVLTFEWILLVTILVIGVIAGLSAVREALTVELADVAQAAGNVNQSYDAGGLFTSVISNGVVNFQGRGSYTNVNGTITTPGDGATIAASTFAESEGEASQFRFGDGVTSVAVSATAP